MTNRTIASRILIVRTAIWKMAPQDASAEFGRETLAAAAQAVIKEVTHRLENRQAYQGHGRSLLEGL